MAEAEFDENGYEYVTEDTVWGKGDHLVQKGVFVDEGATLTIEKGARIVFEKTAEDDPYLYVLNGNIIAIGSPEEKVTFTSADESSVNFYVSFQGPADNDVSFFRYVDFIGGGFNSGGGTFGMRKENFFIPTALAAELSGYATFQYESGKVHVENTTFSDSNYFSVSADAYIGEGYNGGGFLEIVNSNFEINDDHSAVHSEIRCGEEVSDCDGQVLLKDNWYGSALGPEEAGDDEDDMLDLNLVLGQYKLDGWRDNDLIADPVLILPGITGSAQVLGEWRLDPITHTYDDLVQSLEDNGYTEDQNLFEFPYQWRNNNQTSARYLQAEIEGIIKETKISKVDVVAHSMGGLVARAYVEEIDGTIYNNTIDQLITLGTPHKGAVKDYLMWEAGEGFFSLSDRLARYHFRQEAEHAGHDDLQEYIQEDVTSVGQLLPDYDYLFDVDEDKLREYPNDYPRNTFLEELNDDRNVEKLQSVDFTNIVGNLDNDNSTISEIKVEDSTVDGKWENGMPQDFYNSEIGLVFNLGDETVPQYSANEIPANKKLEIDSTHGDLPTEAQCEVIQELTNKETCNYVENWHITNVLLFNVFSPVDIQVFSPSGYIIGKDFMTGDIINEIDGAYYTGFETENEFVTIPNPEDGEYRIVLQGTGDGEYRIEVAEISENEADYFNPIESSVTFNGTASAGSENEMNLVVAGTSISDPDQEEIIEEDNQNNVSDDSDLPVDDGEESVSQTTTKKNDGHDDKKEKKKKKAKTTFLTQVVADQNQANPVATLLENIDQEKEFFAVGKQNDDPQVEGDMIAKPVRDADGQNNAGGAKIEETNLRDVILAIISFLIAAFIVWYLLRNVGIKEYLKNKK